MICSIIVAIVIIGLFLWAKKRSKKLKVFEELSIPGPKPNIFCGNLWDIYTKVRIRNSKTIRVLELKLKLLKILLV
jgi:hypothetical protein